MPMARRADHLASGHLVREDRGGDSVAHELTHGVRLGADVVELQDNRVGFAAVTAALLGERVKHVLRRTPAPGLERLVGLPAMKLPAGSEVRLEAGSAPMLVAVSPAGERVER